MKRTWTAIRHTALLAAAYLSVFLAGKWVLNHNPGLSPLAWLMDTTPLNHSYLFGWLIMHQRFWKCALISLAASFWRKQRFAIATFTGFSSGLLLGEIYHFSFQIPQPHGIPYSWCIWAAAFAVSMIVGIFLEIRKRKI